MDNNFEQQKSLFKRDMENMINKGEYSESLNYLKQYKKMVKDDIDIYSISAIIYTKMNKLKKAEEMLLEGYKIDRTNFDILYNLAYLWSVNGNIQGALPLYKKAVMHAHDKQNAELAYNDMKSLGVTESLSEITDKCKRNKASIIILTLNQLNLTKICIESIRKYTEKGTYEIIVVDNNSTDGTKDWLKQQDDIVSVFNDSNVGYPAGYNIGIKASETDSDIVLLNYNTIVTPNWLENLRDCLYSSESISIAAPVTNFSSKYQNVQVTYKTVEQLLSFASDFNVPDNRKWEQRVNVSSFCMLIKRSAIDTVGEFDERFTPGGMEDDDLCFRMIEKGFKIYLCGDTFVYNSGTVLEKSAAQSSAHKFVDKWGFNSTYSSGIRNDIINLMDLKTKINVLEIGCACGATLTRIKSLDPDADVYGIELNKSAAKISSIFAKVISGNVEKDKLPYEENFFDYIIFGDVLEHLYAPWDVLAKMKKYLKKDGYIIASIPNVMNYHVISNLIRGNWTYEDAGILDRTHIRFFTLSEIYKMFSKQGYEIINSGANLCYLSEDDKTNIAIFKKIFNLQSTQQFQVIQYIVKTKKKPEANAIADGE